MRANRRQFLSSAAALAAAATSTIPAAGASSPRLRDDEIDWSAVRDDFPWIHNSLWISASDYHPLSVESQRMVDTYYKWRIGGPNGGGSRFSSEMQ